VITLFNAPCRRRALEWPSAGLQVPSGAMPGARQHARCLSPHRRCTGVQLHRAGQQSPQRVRVRRDGGVRLRSSLWTAEPSAWTVDSSSRAACWSSRFSDFGMRTARKTTSSSMVFFLAAGTALSSLSSRRCNGMSCVLVQNDHVQVLPIDVSVILREHVIKRSQSFAALCCLPGFSSHREGMRS
jgi:hypothetical protein